MIEELLREYGIETEEDLDKAISELSLNVGIFVRKENEFGGCK